MLSFQALRNNSSMARRVPSCVSILPEVADALSSNRPVVALESTIVAHGMPYPQNLELARDVSQILRNKDVIPATIAIKNGIFRAGLNPDEMEDLSKAGEEGRAIKCSTRDLPLVASNHRHVRSDECIQWGATTAAATMRLAHIAGISTFVTGGTGGVHRGGELSLDTSTDLIELSRTPVVVISAGVKSILDIKRTLEVLETFAVPTGTWQSNEFPAFFSPKSGVKSPAIFENAMDVASAYLTGRNLGMSNGMLVAVPTHDPAGENVEAAIQQALQEADAAGIEGKDITPFILRRVAEKTGGHSLRSNISLVKRNAEVGADIANSIRELSIEVCSKPHPQTLNKPAGVPKSRVVCVGGAVIDTIAQSKAGCKMIIGTSNPGKIHCSHGGVGRNVAEVLGRLGSKPLFYTSIGGDDGGQGILARLWNECGVLTTEESVNIAGGLNTAQYLALLDDNCDLVGGVADMEALANIPVPSTEELDGVKYLLVDSNAPAETVTRAAENGVKAGARVCFEPTSVPKAKLLSASKGFLGCLSFVFPNKDELFAMTEGIGDDGGIYQQKIEGTDEFKPEREAALKLLSRMKSGTDCYIVTTLGSRGVLLTSKTNGSPEFTLFPAYVLSGMKSSNGAGDTLCGAFIHSLLQGSSVEEAVRFGMRAALLSLDCADHAVSPNLSLLATDDVCS